MRLRRPPRPRSNNPASRRRDPRTRWRALAVLGQLLAADLLHGGDVAVESAVVVGDVIIGEECSDATLAIISPAGVVGRIDSVDAHPSADRLRVCRVDVGTRVAIYKFIAELCEAGAAILLISLLASVIPAWSVSREEPLSLLQAAAQPGLRTSSTASQTPVMTSVQAAVRYNLTGGHPMSHADKPPTAAVSVTGHAATTIANDS